MASGESTHSRYHDSRLLSGLWRRRMTQPMIAALVAVGVVAMALLAVLRLMRPRQMTLPDYPELPAPPKDDGGSLS